MSVFEFSNGTTIGPTELAELQIMVKVREPDRLDELPNNFTVITQEMLNYGNDQDGYIDDQGYFHAGFDAIGGQSIAILEDDNTISISFRGTNDTTDMFSVSGFSDNSYIYGFEDWLTSVAEFASENDYTIEWVTGKSLGGAAVNMLRDESEFIADGAYSQAKFFAVASPLLAERNDDILNYGYQNDYAYEWYEKRFDDGDVDHENAVDNMVFYNKNYHQDGIINFDFSSHNYNDFRDGTNALISSQFAKEMKPDDNIVLAEHQWVRVQQPRDDLQTNDPIYVIATQDHNYNIVGTDKSENVETGAGDDLINTGPGDDVIYSQSGDDLVRSGTGNDRVYGGDGIDDLRGYHGDDRLYGGNQNDRLDGGNDQDRLYGGNHHDQLYGGNASDYLYGQSGNDQLFGGQGDDRLHGGRGNDLMDAGIGNDALFGGNGHDQLYGGSGDDRLVGGSRNDFLSGGEGDDLLIGGRGRDVFELDAQGNDVIQDFQLDQDKLQRDDMVDDEIHARFTDDGLILDFKDIEGTTTAIIELMDITPENTQRIIDQNDKYNDLDDVLFGPDEEDNFFL